MRRTIAIIAFTAAVLLTQGCASFLSIGHENFACKGDEEGGLCQDPMTVYKHRKQILKKELESKKAKAEKKESPADKTTDKQEETASLSDKDHTQRSVPVRQTEEIRRVYVNGFEDRNGNLIGDFWGYVIVRGGKWLTPDGRRLRNAENKQK